MSSITARMHRMLEATGPVFTAPTLSRYLSDPEYRANLDAERAAKQAEIGAEFDAFASARQAAAWARDPEPDLDAPVLNQCTGGMK